MDLNLVPTTQSSLRLVQTKKFVYFRISISAHPQLDRYPAIIQSDFHCSTSGPKPACVDPQPPHITHKEHFCVTPRMPTHPVLRSPFQPRVLHNLERVILPLTCFRSCPLKTPTHLRINARICRRHQTKVNISSPRGRLFVWLHSRWRFASGGPLVATASGRAV